MCVGVTLVCVVVLARCRFSLADALTVDSWPGVSIGETNVSCPIAPMLSESPKPSSAGAAAQASRWKKDGWSSLMFLFEVCGVLCLSRFAIRSLTRQP